MGMFDTLIFRCVMCGEENYEQTKSGPCMLDNFNMEDDLPVWLMEDFNGLERECYKCGKNLKFIFELEISVKRKEIIPTDNLDLIEYLAKKKGL